MPCSPGCLWTYVAQPGLAREILLFQPLGCWDYMGFHHVQQSPNFRFISHTPITGDVLSWLLLEMNQTISGRVGCLINNITLGFTCKNCCSLLPLGRVLSAGVERLCHYLFAIIRPWETESWLRSETNVWTSTRVKSDGKWKIGLSQGQRQEPLEAGLIKQENEVEGWSEWKLGVCQRWKRHARKPGGPGKTVHGSGICLWIWKAVHYTTFMPGTAVCFWTILR